VIGAREATAVALLPLALAGIVLLPGWVFLGMVWVFTVLAGRELLTMMRRLRHPVPVVATLVVLGAALPALWWTGIGHSGAILAAVVLLTPAAYLLGGFPPQGAIAGIASATFTAAYLFVTGGAMGLLRTAFPGSLGVKVVLLHCLMIWGGDSGAYYLGTWIGRHRLAPRVSPKKSWEGVAGGTVLTFAMGFACRAVFFTELRLPALLALAALLSVLAPIGDLVESLFKRDAGVKDSSDVLPGHGGFLDRIDSLFYAAPFVLAFFLLFGAPS
jgi:phosphatidate cytidylyltransferase